MRQHHTLHRRRQWQRLLVLRRGFQVLQNGHDLRRDREIPYLAIELEDRGVRGRLGSEGARGDFGDALDGEAAAPGVDCGRRVR